MAFFNVSQSVFQIGQKYTLPALVSSESFVADNPGPLILNDSIPSGLAELNTGAPPPVLRFLTGGTFSFTMTIPISGASFIPGALFETWFEYNGDTVHPLSQQGGAFEPIPGSNLMGFSAVFTFNPGDTLAWIFKSSQNVTVVGGAPGYKIDVVRLG